MGSAYGRALLLMHRPFGRDLVLPYPFVDLVFGTPRIVDGRTHPFTDNVWQPRFELALSAGLGWLPFVVPD